jgi:hypothetical protein
MRCFALNMIAIKEINIAAAVLNLRVLLLTFALCGIACLLCGIAPAWMFRLAGVHEALKQSGRQSGPGRGSRKSPAR